MLSGSTQSFHGWEGFGKIEQESNKEAAMEASKSGEGTTKDDAPEPLLPLAQMRKALSHVSFDMLKVVD